jgi:hypothetical protein
MERARTQSRKVKILSHCDKTGEPCALQSSDNAGNDFGPD